MDNNNAPQKKKKTSIFFRGLMRDGKGVEKDDVIKIDEYNLKNFFKLYWRRISEIIRINWLYLFGNFPALALLLVISGNFSHAAVAPTSQFFPVFYGMTTISGETSAVAPMLGAHAVMGTTTAYSWVDYVLFGVSALLLVTFGLVNTGCAYLMRNLVRGEHLFLWQDFKSAIKQNFRQGLIIGIIDAVVLFLCGYSIAFYLANYSSYFIMFFAAIAMTVVYMFARYYMYTILVTFELGIFKILKNSLIFAFISAGKNFLALLATVLIFGAAFMLSALFMPIGIILLLMLLVATGSYISTYLAFPKIKKVMIDPYYPNYGKEPTEDENEDNA